MDSILLNDCVILPRLVYEAMERRLERVETVLEAVQKAEADDPVLTVNEAAEFLRVHPETVRQARREERLKGVQINEKSWGFRQSELDRYLKRYHRTPDPHAT